MIQPKLTIEVVWDDPRGITSPELAATWARLAIRAVDWVPTRVFDRRARTVRDELYVSTYPLAEWIACNWYPIFHETTPRQTRKDWQERHCLRSGREGMSVPPLFISGDGLSIQLSCERLKTNHEPVEFLCDGMMELPASAVRDELSRFVSLTVSRLETAGIRGTRLQEEWSALSQLGGEEEEFCIACAQLGQDPFSIPEPMEEEIINAASLLQPELRAPFFEAASLPTLADDLAFLLKHVRRAGGKPGNGGVLSQMRQVLPTNRQNPVPWQQGYELARRLRSQLGIGETRITSLSALLASFELERSRCLVLADWTSLFDSLAGPGRSGHPVFVLLRDTSPTSQRFAFCRAVGEFLETGSWSMANSSHSISQKRNRAFAAEFLAPAEQLRKALPGDMVDGESVSRLAEQFGVSERVIKHQIDNHHLATVLDSSW